MKRTLILARAICFLTAAATAGAQSVAVSPFDIGPGTSFSASTGTEPAVRSTLSAESRRVVSDFAAVLELIRRNHVDGRHLDPDILAKSAINTMLGELDPHSSYFDAAEFNELLGEQNGEYSGTGSTISNFVRDGRIETYFVATQPGSAAARAYLRYGDRIVAVDGVAASGLMVDVVRDRVRGPRGTMVRLTVERASTGAIETVDLRRERVPQPSVRDAFLVRDGVGYVSLSDGFSHTTAAEFNLAVDDLARHGMRSLILDLRENTGGILDQAVKVAERFLPRGAVVISQRGRSAEENITLRSANRAPIDVPIVVLVNARTASAAEIVAGALQDNDRAVILGQTTFGKGLVQRVVELPGGSGLTLSTARYFTPSGRSIQRTYSGSGMYDYFTNRQTPGKDAQLTRTLTNRPVSGGTGITPDEMIPTEKFILHRAELIDPIFFFVREMMRREAAPTANTGARNEVATARTFTNEQLLANFRAYATGPSWRIPNEIFDAEAGFILQQLDHQVALAIDGPEKANRLRIRSDKAVARAVSVIPRAAALAKTAREVNRSREMK